MTIGQRIQNLRKERNMTQKQLSEIIGKGFSTVQKYEIDAIQPPNSVIQKIAEAFSISLADFFSGLNDDDMQKITDEALKSADRIEEKASIALASETKSILRYYEKLNLTGKRKVVQYAIDLSKLEEYTSIEYDLKQYSDSPQD